MSVLQKIYYRLALVSGVFGLFTIMFLLFYVAVTGSTLTIEISLVWLLFFLVFHALTRFGIRGLGLLPGLRARVERFGLVKLVLITFVATFFLLLLAVVA